MHRGEVFHLLWWQNDTKPRDNDNNIFYSHLSLHTQSLQSTWQTPAEWMEVPRAAFGTGQGGTVHQPSQTTRVTAKAEAPWVIPGSVVISDSAPRLSAHPHATGTFPPSVLPTVHAGSHQSRAGRRWREAQAGFYLPLCFAKVVGTVALQWGISAHCLQAAESLPQLSPDKTSGLSRRSHILQICQGVALWQSCTLTKLHSDIPRAIPACCCTFSALSLCLFGIWKVWSGIMISMIAIILLFTQDVLLEPLLLVPARWGSRVHCDSCTRFSLWWCKL